MEELRQIQKEIETIIEENYSRLKGKFECKRCGKKISSNFALLMSLHFIPSEDKVLCPDCLQKYIYEIEKCIKIPIPSTAEPPAK